MRKALALLSVFSLLLLVSPSIASVGFSPVALPSQGSQDFSSIRVQRLLDLHQSAPEPAPTGLYLSYSEMTDLLFSLSGNHSDIMSVTSLGKTYEGRDLWLVKLSDNVSQQEQEPEVLFTGAHHGDELPGYQILLYFIQYMVDDYHNNSEVRDAVDSTQIYVIPMVNPDGVEAYTRKNQDPNHGWFGYRHRVTSVGVDLNRNYEDHWPLLFLRPVFYGQGTSFVDRSSVYRGPEPFSENETRAVRDFVDAHDILISIDYHTYGELILYPWGYTLFPPKDVQVFDSIAENISHVDGYLYEQSISLYPTLGDICDWLYATHNVLAFTIELGESVAPDDPAVLHQMSVDHVKVNLYVCERALTLGR